MISNATCFGLGRKCSIPLHFLYQQLVNNWSWTTLFLTAKCWPPGPSRWGHGRLHWSAFTAVLLTIINIWLFLQVLRPYSASATAGFAGQKGNNVSTSGACLKDSANWLWNIEGQIYRDFDTWWRSVGQHTCLWSRSWRWSFCQESDRKLASLSKTFTRPRMWVTVLTELCMFVVYQPRYTGASTMGRSQCLSGVEGR